MWIGKQAEHLWRPLASPSWAPLHKEVFTGSGGHAHQEPQNSLLPESASKAVQASYTAALLRGECSSSFYIRVAKG